MGASIADLSKHNATAKVELNVGMMGIRKKRERVPIGLRKQERDTLRDGSRANETTNWVGVGGD